MTTAPDTTRADRRGSAIVLASVVWPGRADHGPGWAAGLGYKGVQIPGWDGRVIASAGACRS